MYDLMREIKSIVKVRSVFVVKFFEFLLNLFQAFLSMSHKNPMKKLRKYNMHELFPGSEYNMANIFQVFHILSTYFMSL